MLNKISLIEKIDQVQHIFPGIFLDPPRKF